MAPSSQAPDIFDDATRALSKTSVLRSIIPSKVHRRSPSAGEVQVPRPTEGNPFGATPLPPADHPDAALFQRPLSERAHNRDAAGTVRSHQKPGEQSGKKGLHTKTKSSVSLKSLVRDRDSKESRSSESSENDSKGRKPKKTKSSTSLSAILKRSQRGRKGELAKDVRDKENQTPSESSETPSSPSPVWSQFTARPLQDESEKVYFPEKGRTLDDAVSLYTPKCYSPSKQRSFFDYHQPALVKSRPKSDCITSGSWKVREMRGSMQRTPSNPEYHETLQREPSGGSEWVRKVSGSSTRSSAGKKQESNPKRCSHVMATVSALNTKDKEAEAQKKLDPKDIDTEFEKLLDARNVPSNMREKMRSLDTHIKADFIQKDRADSSLSFNSTSSNTASTDGSGRHRRAKDNSTTPAYREDKPRSRSRSRTFTFSKGNSSKKQKSELGTFYKRPKSVDLSSRPASAKTMTPPSSIASLSATLRHDTAADPSDFVHYLREVQRPEIVEVGKLHKLRILLRHETVSWVDRFILEGGMDEVIQLLYRIMKVEWREEHEDALLHETLLCLKALCTTSLALTHLTTVESELFPALLRMLFDKERKGPSEYTTRGIIINLLFTHLSTAPADAISARASTILSYLRDPSPPEENQPLDFIANIYQSRPYRLWCKEVTSVTKEVFWIFLHHLNVVPIVEPSNSTESSPEATSYLKRHFPPPRPPVPAAPYVGGVEWEATNYVAAHLDLMNGLIASLPTTEERNALRTELRASGFEKVMGGSLRTCKEKFHSAVHDCLKTWVAAALEDGWDYTFVREGPPRAGGPGSPTRSPVKAVGGSPKKGRADEAPPKLELALDLDGDRNAQKQNNDITSWL